MVLALTTASGCAHRDGFLSRNSEVVSRPAAERPGIEPAQAVASPAMPPAGREGLGPSQRPPSALPAAVSPALSAHTPSVGVVPLPGQSGIRDQLVQPASHAGSSLTFTAADVAIPHEASPRVGSAGDGPLCRCGANSPEGACPVMIPGPGVVAWDPTHYPDEYLCDGGDRGLPFHYQGRHLGGLETEDTVAESVDERGRRVVVPSSQVCIYAPRFGALRTITGVQMDQKSEKAAGAQEWSRAGGVDTHLAIVTETQRDRLQQLDLRARASGVEASAGDGSLHQALAPQGSQALLAVHQNLTFLSDGLIRQADLPILAYAAQCAGVWTRDQYPILAGHDARGAAVEARFHAREYVGTEDRRKPGQLRIVKLADVETARPGDIVTFTLRFDNLGQRDLFGVRIIDNLTPRLEYIEGSVVCARPGSLTVEPNGEGSSILIFELDDPLAGESGDVITFQCRVR